ncbi:uncharacterized protein At3g49055-like [Macadamia integrifolia]|uniref:uncharacterized protein At3g49055-like n=1 Tax=Macadamia integrifolia TaxID=60698 RepID=UPI001C4FA7F7|nr:uncharacterized protein At3g49055-like [Macadamia integrifolia]
MDDASDDRKDEYFSNDDEQNTAQHLHQLQTRNDALLAELEALRVSYQNLQSRSVAMKDSFILLQQQKDEALNRNFDLVKAVEDITNERDALRNELHGLEVAAKEREDELIRQRDEELKEKLDLRSEAEASLEKISGLLEERTRRIRVFVCSLDLLRSTKECLGRIVDRISEGKSNGIIEEVEHTKDESDFDEESKGFLSEMTGVHKLTTALESRLTEYEEMRRKEKRELENSVVSLTEENRDINSLLRIALVEKEAVERALSKLKGTGEHKRVAILQIAEKGLQKVGFGFMMGASAGDTSQTTDNSSSNSCSKSESSDYDQEVVSLASTVEKIMKNLRLEITQLKTSLDESRSDTERLQSLTEKQAQKIAESGLYIKELEERESMLAQNVEELMMELTTAEEEIARWREACELEVEAGKNAIEERDREVARLTEELEKMEASLDLLDSKLKLKEELATTAMAAQAAAERSLQLADSRAAGLRERIEELTKQLDEADRSGERKNRHRVRHICWPWHALRVNSAGMRGRNVKRMLPEMEALLHVSV